MTNWQKRFKTKVIKGLKKTPNAKYSVFEGKTYEKKTSNIKNRFRGKGQVIDSLFLPKKGVGHKYVVLIKHKTKR